jgi:quercetin dioxygenase-like cupin family protein
LKFDKEYGANIARLGKGDYGEGRLVQMDAVLVELPPGGKLAAHKHLYEEMIYIVAGTGYTSMWKPGPNGAASKKRYDWKASDVLSPSLNAWHETVNTSSTESARFLVMTSAPLTNHLFWDTASLASSDHVFEDRWNKGIQEPKFLERPGRNGGKVDLSLMSIGHFIPDMLGMKMPIAFGDPTYPEEGINVVPPMETSTGSNALGGMAGNKLFEWQNREYIKADAGTHEEGNHHHSWEVVYICPVGQMITYQTRQDGNQKGPKRTVKWNAGDLMINEADEIHQHYTPEKGTRFLQFKLAGYYRNVGIGGIGITGGAGGAN